MTSTRAGHVAAALQDGSVLIVGGFDGSQYLASAELYNPATARFTATAGSMSIARTGHSATLLALLPAPAAQPQVQGLSNRPDGFRAGAPGR